MQKQLLSFLILMLTMGCLAAQPLSVTIVGFTNVNCNSVCDGTANTSTTGGVTPYTYSWVDLSIPDTIPGETSDSITGLCAGDYAVVVIDSAGTIDSAFVTITEPAIFISAISGQTDVPCFGLCDGTATVTTTGGTPPNTYLWLDSAFIPLNPPQTDSIAINLCAESYTVQVEDSNGCSSISIVTITEPPILNISLDSMIPSQCSSCNGIASVSAAGGTPPYTYSWNDAYSQSTSLADSLCISTYTASVSDGNSCLTTLNIIVTDPGGFFSSLDTSISLTCSGSCDGQAEVAGIGGNPPYTYAWINSIPDTITGATDDTITGLCAGNYIGVVTNNDTCVSTTATITIVEPPAFTATITDSTSVSCFGDSDGTATVSIINGISPYDYSWSSGNSTIGAINTTNVDSGLAAGIYFITVTDSNGCTAIDSTTIPTPMLLGSIITDSSDVICGGTCTGSATVTQIGGTAPYIYLWDSGANPNDSATTGLCAGAHNVTVTDTNGCISVTTVTIAEPAALLPIITDSAMVSCNGLCDGNATITTTGGVLPLTYSWSNGDTLAFADSLCAGVFSFTVIDSNNCNSQDSITITEPLMLAANIVGIGAVCEPLCNGIETSVPSGGTTPYSYLWSNGDTISSADSLCSGAIQLTLIDSNGCIASDSSVIASDTIEPVVDAGIDLEVCEGETVSLGAIGTPIIGGYSWTPTVGLSCTNCPSPEATPSATTTYQVVATNIVCTDTDEVIITVIMCIVDPIPEIITPNQDGTNDIFEIPNIAFYPENSVSIFNEWGDLVFNVTGYNNLSNYWDGKSNSGIRLPDGTYFYVLTLGDGTNPKSGFVMIYR